MKIDTNGMSIGRVICERYSKRYGKEFEEVAMQESGYKTLYCAFNPERPCSPRCISCFKNDARMMCQRGENDWLYIGHIEGEFEEATEKEVLEKIVKNKETLDEIVDEVAKDNQTQPET